MCTSPVFRVLFVADIFVLNVEPSVSQSVSQSAMMTAAGGVKGVFLEGLY
jgi:hypothetical protein